MALELEKTILQFSHYLIVGKRATGKTTLSNKILNILTKRLDIFPIDFSYSHPPTYLSLIHIDNSKDINDVISLSKHHQYCLKDSNLKPVTIIDDSLALENHLDTIYSHLNQTKTIVSVQHILCETLKKLENSNVLIFLHRTMATNQMFMKQFFNLVDFSETYQSFELFMREFHRFAYESYFNFIMLSLKTKQIYAFKEI